ncbi:MAG: hypothetical protein CVU57_17490 [Deltaproteobacteria bacterium HGW-Deltaproteobacteria-15]|jgi:hypothetical protein|nr:MAG: hypothetical protein CVU57_17490 [Deltaproteobacteria bacterium HGW-Deltaproteobacteria-15]
MRKVIVTTTVHPPTRAIRLFDAMPDWELIVVGDLKTPTEYSLDRGIYLDPASQEKYDKPLSDAIGWNCVERRNFGLLFANDMKADIVAMVDDDNVPMPVWGRDLLLDREGEVTFYETDLPAFDPVGATNYREIWHRGYPLQLLSRRDYSAKSRKRLRADVQADFWNGDPDIDAVCRMEHAPICRFEDSSFPMASNRIGPFNSQNTFLRGELLHNYFLFPFIGRMSDIWASYHLQARGISVVYGKPSVFHERNAHDPVRDMREEYLGYENNLRIVEALPNAPDVVLGYLPERTLRAFQLYQRHFEKRGPTYPHEQV